MSEENIKNSDSIKSQIDQLYEEVQYYRNSKDFMDLLNFCAHFKTLSAYNAMLVNMQLPSAKYVLTAEDWRKKYNRRPKRGERPMIILIPFGPVKFVFDVSATEPILGEPTINAEELEQLCNPYEAEGNVDPRVMDYLDKNLPLQGIDPDYNMTAASSYAANIILHPVQKQISVEYKGLRHQLWGDQFYQMNVNRRAYPTERFVSTCHELGHLFCHHIDAPKTGMWDTRKVSLDVEEFEAETVAWLVTKRFGVVNSKSKEYLANYVGEHEEIPDVSIEAIMRSVSDIEKMLKQISLKDSFLYKKSDTFKHSVDAMIEQEKRDMAAGIKRIGTIFRRG